MGYELSMSLQQKKIIDNNDDDDDDDELNRVPSVEISQVIDLGNMSEAISGLHYR